MLALSGQALKPVDSLEQEEFLLFEFLELAIHRGIVRSRNKQMLVGWKRVRIWHMGRGL